MMTSTISVQFVSKVRPITEQMYDTKSIASVRDVARMVGLSTARFYQLQQSGIFPLPVYDINTRRPHYTEVQQQECMEVRRRNCGVNGKAIIFYSRRRSSPTPAPRPRSNRKEKTGAVTDTTHAEILDSLRGLGLTTATTAQVQSALKELFPSGVIGVDEGEIIRALFIHLRRQNSSDSVGR
jgi:hypothetical protein